MNGIIIRSNRGDKRPPGGARSVRIAMSKRIRLYALIVSPR